MYVCTYCLLYMYYCNEFLRCMLLRTVPLSFSLQNSQVVMIEHEAIKSPLMLSVETLQPYSYLLKLNNGMNIWRKSEKCNNAT